jgi:hypothetical protein
MFRAPDTTRGRHELQCRQACQIRARGCSAQQRLGMGAECPECAMQARLGSHAECVVMNSAERRVMAPYLGGLGTKCGGSSPLVS